MSAQLITSEELLRRYKKGHITANGVILSLLNLTGKRRLLRALEILPEDLLQGLKDFVDNYKRQMRVFRGPHPKAQSVRTVREWLKNGARPTPPKQDNHKDRQLL
jgi:hypothetical protein